MVIIMAMENPSYDIKENRSMAVGMPLRDLSARMDKPNGRDANALSEQGLPKPHEVESKETIPTAFIYILRRVKDGSVKIGRALNCKRRIAEQNRLNDPLEVIATVKVNYPGDVERHLHRQFSDKVVRLAEWFDLTDADIAQSLDYLNVLPFTEAPVGLRHLTCSICGLTWRTAFRDVARCCYCKSRLWNEKERRPSKGKETK